MSISPITPTTTASRSNSANAAAMVGNNLTQDDFLKLLTVQLQNQDPMEPMKDTEFVSQLANFTSLQQTTDMSKTLTILAGTMQQTGSVAYLGKQVTLTDNQGKEISGLVSKVGVEDGMMYVLVNGQKYNVFSITSVTNPAPTTTTTGPTIPVTTTTTKNQTEQHGVNTTTPVP